MAAPADETPAATANGAVSLPKEGFCVERILNEQISASSLVAAYAAEIERRKDLNAYITVTPEDAARQAEESDRRRADGTPRPLEGLPISIKDNFCTKGVRTTAGSKMLENFVPAYESTITQKLRDAGAVFLGKTNLDEFGMGSSTENSYFGPSINPVGSALGKTDLSPGGSSGGAAASVAGNLCAAAIGTDTGGSIRQPASFCGLVGYKPTYGLCSRWGIVAYASSLDQAGVITKTVGDAATLMDVMVGHDDKDSTSLRWEGPSFKESFKDSLDGLTVGFPLELKELATSPAQATLWENAVATFEKAGAKVVSVSLPSISYALPAYYIIALCEASSNLARYDGVRYGYRSPNISNIEDLYMNSRAEGFLPETVRRILLGTYSLSSGYYDMYYHKALKVRRVIASEFEAAFQTVDTLFWPTTPSGAFAFGAHKKDPVSMYLEDAYTVPVNLAGLPAVSVPFSTTEEGLPMGLTIAGARMHDHLVFQCAKALEDQLKG